MKRAWGSHRSALTEVEHERARQDEKWGVNNHNNFYWLPILTEEVGEVAKETLSHDALRVEEYLLRKELVQVAAVAVAWIECIDRRAHGG